MSSAWGEEEGERRGRSEADDLRDVWVGVWVCCSACSWVREVRETMLADVYLNLGWFGWWIELL